MTLFSINNSDASAFPRKRPFYNSTTARTIPRRSRKRSGWKFSRRPTWDEHSFIDRKFWRLGHWRGSAHPRRLPPCSPRLKRDSYRRFLGCRSWKGRHGPNVSQTECAQRTAASVLAFAQQQFERCLPCAMSLRHGLEIDLGLLDWRCPPGAIDRPPPWLLSPSPVLDDYGKVAVVDHGVDIKAKLGFESTEQRDREAWAVHRR